MTNKLIILDRDGVINYDSNDYIKSPEEWHAIPGSLDAIARLYRAGFTIVIATNQSGVARGYYDIPMLENIHQKLKQQVESAGGMIDAIFYCPHHPDEKCLCRKPQLGMFHRIQQQYHCPLDDVFFIGDSATDIEVAKKLPCKPMLVLTSKGQKTLDDNPEFSSIPHFANLAAAVDYILKHS